MGRWFTIREQDKELADNTIEKVFWLAQAHYALLFYILMPKLL